MKDKHVIIISFTFTVVFLAFLTIFATKKGYSKELKNFDFGNKSVASGYIGVDASTPYSKDRGYGFNQPENMENVDGSTDDELSDAVVFNEYGIKSDNTFNVDLEDGIYEVTIQTGPTSERTRVVAEGYLQEFNILSDNEKRTFRLPVSDGQLNILVTSSFGESGEYTLSSLTIDKVSTDVSNKQNIWLCGDSTVAEYAQTSDDVNCGWGQVLHEFVDTSKYEIRNFSSGGQYATNFLYDDEFDPIEYYGKKGDYFVMVLGGNDVTYSTPDDFYQAVSYMTDIALEKEMKVIYVQQPPLSDAVSLTPDLTDYWSNKQLGEMGEEKGVKVVDLFTPSFDFFKSIGQEETFTYFIEDDNEHTNEKGARLIAKYFVDGAELAPARPISIE